MWGLFYEQNKGWGLTVARQYGAQSGEEEDIYQEAQIYLYSRIEDVKDHPGKLLFLNIRRKALDSYRRNKLFREKVGKNLMPDTFEEPDVADIHSYRETLDECINALNQIRPEYKDAIVQTRLKGLSTQEVAAMYDIPQNTVKSHIHRGTMQMGQILEQGMETYLDAPIEMSE